MGRFPFKSCFASKKIVQALIEIGLDEETANSFFEISKNTFSISSTELAQLIANYCKSRGPEYRIVFLVDEVGQYIGTDGTLMLNLQTVVEDIGSATMGQAWVIVTSQEKIKAAVNVHSEKDFSKIQGRFATRINLSSANTDEVIKRRLLEKEEVPAKTLKSMYDSQEFAIKSRLNFDKESTQYRSGYRNSIEFAELYPFIPYQVELLQDVFNKIRIHGEGGTSLAHGERSLLKAFQEAAKLNSGEDIGNLVTLAEFYPSIRSFLETSITQTITRAEDRAKNNEGLELEDVDVLKVLYLIKGIDKIKATPNNITRLLLGSIYDDHDDYHIKESLSRLEQAMFIEKHADGTYSFLSDEEQEINKEIRNVEVNPIKIKEQLGELFFTKLYPKPKFEYRKDTPPFDYNKRFDNYTKGNMTNALTLQVFSIAMSDMEAALKANSGQLVICLDEEIVAEAESAIKYSEQVQKYVNFKKNNSTTETQKRIYESKLSQVDDFEQKAEELLIKAAENARFFIQGQERTFKGSFENKVNSAFELLIKNTYSRLDYVDEQITFKTHKEVWRKLVENGIEHDLLQMTGNRRAYDEMKDYFEEISRWHEKPSLKAVIDKFQAVPYGWSEYDIIGLTLALLNAGKVKFTMGDNPFTSEQPNFYDRLSRVSEREKIRVIPEIEVDPKIKREFISIIREFFGDQDFGETYQDFTSIIVHELNERIAIPLEKIIKKRREQKSFEYPYPGEREINELSMGINQILQIRDPEQMVNAFINAEDDLETWLESIEKLNGFYNKTPIMIFDETVETLGRLQKDLSIIQDNNVLFVKKQITDILTSPNPYRDIPKLPQLTSQLETKINEIVNEQRLAISVQVDRLQKKISESREYYLEIPSIIDYIDGETQKFNSIKSKLEHEKSLVIIRVLLQDLIELANKIENKAKQLEVEYRNKPTDQPSDDETVNVIREKQSKKLHQTDLYRLFFNGRTKIETQQDLDQALQELRKSLLRELKDHTLEIE